MYFSIDWWTFIGYVDLGRRNKRNRLKMDLFALTIPKSMELITIRSSINGNLVKN